MASPEKTPQKNENNMDNLIGYFKTHTRETITYIILVLGIVVLFFDQIYGGIIVGVIAGIYFGNEIIAYLKSWRSAKDSRAIARNLISAGIAIAFLITAPAIFLGAAIAIGIQQLFINPAS